MRFDLTFEEAMDILKNRIGWVQGERFDEHEYLAIDRKSGYLIKNIVDDSQIGCVFDFWCFLDKNKEYIVEAYISNTATSHIIGRLYVATDRTFKTDDKGFTLEWDNKQDITYNNLSVLYDDILACYDETDEYDQQMIFVILKCGISIDFGCCGMN